MDFSGHYAPGPAKNNLTYALKSRGVRHPLAQHFSRPTDLQARFLPPQELKGAPSRTLHYGRYILWRGERRNNELIISSHGSRLLGNPFTVPPGMELRFYGPDYASIDTYNIYRAFVRDAVARRHYETLYAGQPCVDYHLTTYQREYSNYSEVYEDVQACLPYYDVVTITTAPTQNWQDWVQLSELLAHLRLNRHSYSRIHDFHCRSMTDSTVHAFPAVKSYAKPAHKVR